MKWYQVIQFKEVLYVTHPLFTDQGISHPDQFHLDSGTGELTLSSQLDYDLDTGGTPFFDVTIKAVDGGASPKSVESTFRVSVGAENDNPPVFQESMYQAVIAEDASIDSFVLNVHATDADGDTLTYTVTGEGVGVFGNVGVDVITVTKLDFETRRCYTFNLR